MNDLISVSDATCWCRGDYEISTDKTRLDVPFVHSFLANETYWANEIDRHLVERAISGSLTLGLFHRAQQVGFGRVVSDGASFAYLRDVFVIPAHRGKGLAGWMTECAVGHPKLVTVQKWMLATDDAHSVYARAGFRPLQRPEIYMERIGVVET